MTESVEWERLADHEEGAPEPADSWYDDARITEVQLDAIRSDLGDNGRAQYSRAAMRKVMAEIDRLQGHLNAIAVAHEEGVMARRRLDEIRDEDNAALKQRARAAERYIDQLRSELTTARGAMEILRGAGEEQCTRAETAEAERNAARRELAEVRQRIGEQREEWGVRTYDSDDDTEVMRTREQAEDLATAWRTEIPNSNPTVRVRTQCAPGPWRDVEDGERKAADGG